MTQPTAKPQRIQLSRVKGWRMPPNTVKVDRTTKWGNPWRVWKDDDGQWQCSNRSCHYPVPNKTTGLRLAVEKHAADENTRAQYFGGATRLAELRGKNLACWCPLGQPCHADILLKLANPEARDMHKDQAPISTIEAMEGFLSGASWTYSIPPAYTMRVRLIQVIAGGVPLPMRDSALHNGFYVWLEYWAADWSQWARVSGSLSTAFSTLEAALEHASQVWAREGQS